MSGSLVSPDLRARVRGLAVPVARGFGRLGLTPNHLTVIGFAIALVAAWAAASQAWLVAGLLVIGGGVFDLFDGALARATGQVSKFGAFLDSTLDRTGESVIFAGIAFGAAAAQFPSGVILAGLALAFASSVTYARAKAESLGYHGEVGVAPRSERLVILAIGLALAGIPGGVLGFGQAWLGGALFIIALLSAVTVGQRILYVRAQAREG